MFNSKTPRLNPHVKHLFIRHCGFVLYRPKNYRDRKKSCSSSDFFKFLIISKGYLLASQRHKIYELQLFGLHDKEKYWFCVRDVQKLYYWLSQERSYISFENLCQLNKLLKFAYIEICLSDNMDLENINETNLLFQNHLTQAKLNLCFGSSFSPISFATSFFQTFSDRIYKLEADVEVIEDFMPMKLEYCQIKDVKRPDQIKSALLSSRKSIRNCEFNYHKTFDWENIGHAFFDDFPLCSRLNDFKFSISAWPTKILDDFECLLKAVPFFPNLKKLHVTIKGQDDDFFNSGKNSKDAVNIALKILKGIQDFQEKCSSLLEVEIYCVFIGKTEDSNEMVEKSMKLFENAQTSQEFSLYSGNVYDRVEHYFLLDYKRDNFDVEFIFQIWVDK